MTSTVLGAFSASWHPRCGALSPSKAGLNQYSGLLAAMGVGALGLHQIADVAVGKFVRGITLAQQLAHFATAPGVV